MVINNQLIARGNRVFRKARFLAIFLGSTALSIQAGHSLVIVEGSVKPLNLVDNPHSEANINIGTVTTFNGVANVATDGKVIVIGEGGAGADLSTTKSIDLGGSRPSLFGSSHTIANGTLEAIGGVIEADRVLIGSTVLNIFGKENAGTGSLVLDSGSYLKSGRADSGSGIRIGDAYVVDTNGSSESNGSLVVKNGSVVDTTSIAVGNNATGSVGTLEVTGGSRISVRNRDFGDLFVLGDGEAFVDWGGIGIAQGSDILVSGEGSQIYTDTLAVNWIVPGESKQKGNPAKLTVSDGASFVVDAATAPTTIGGGGEAYVFVGSGDEVSNLSITNSGPGELTAGGQIAVPNLLIGQSSVYANSITGFEITDYDEFAGHGVLEIGPNGKVAVEGISVLGGMNGLYAAGSSDYFLSTPRTVNGNGELIIRDGGELRTTQLTIMEGGLLTGDGGTIIGDVVLNGGTIAPGASPGVMNIDGDFQIIDGTLAIEVGGRDIGQYDILNVSGDFIGSDPFDINISFLNGFVPDEDESFNFLNILGDSSAISALFAAALVDVNIDGLIPEFNLNLSFDGGVLSAVATKNISNVPLPAGAILLFTGLVGLGAANARLRRAKSNQHDFWPHKASRYLK